MNETETKKEGLDAIDFKYEKEQNIYPSIRMEQKRILQFIKRSKKKFLIIEGPTGVGKSICAWIASLAVKRNESQGKTWMLTPQKLLQNQYDRDFSEHGLINLKSKCNYQCSHNPKRNCEEGQADLEYIHQIIKKKGECEEWNSDNIKLHPCCGDCSYKRERQKFITYNQSMTNFAFFLTALYKTDLISPRELLIIDECHNTETALMNFITLNLASNKLLSTLELMLPDYETIQEYIAWMEDKLHPSVISGIEEIDYEMERNVSGGSAQNELNKRRRTLTNYLDNSRVIISDYKDSLDDGTFFNWVMDKKDKKTKKYGAKIEVSFKPVDVKKHTKRLFTTGEKVILMSATISDFNYFAHSLGIDEDSFDYIRTPCPFPKNNRKIIVNSVGKMSAQYKSQTLPKMIDKIKELIDKHKNEKGIIHTNSYEIKKSIIDGVGSDRFLFHESGNRDEVYQQHLNSDKPTILISPSMTEGIDLKDDFARFQIICKVPFPYLGDPQVKKRMDIEPEWYKLRTALTLIQSFGRIVRSTTDYGTTYILDSSFNGFYFNNETLFPNWLNIIWEKN